MASVAPRPRRAVWIASPVAAPSSAGRLVSLDVMRGLVMVLMAIDHVRVYSGIPAGGPTPGIFFTRWITHFCAPAFVFFAGMQELAAVRARQRRPAWEDEEPLEVRPVRPVSPLVTLSPPPLPALMFQPKISVYTWDNQTGTWRKDSP